MVKEEGYEVRKMVIVDEKYCYGEEIELTIHKKSMFREGDGFTVYDPNGDIIFRVDYYGLMKHHRLLLMDSIGNPLVTLLPKRPTLHHRLEAFLGDTSSEDQEPIFSIWKSTIIGRSKMIVEVYHATTIKEYHIQGCFRERDCTISRVGPVDTSLEQVAQIKRKVEPTREMVLGKDVFSLIVKPGIDAAFAMALVLALDAVDADHLPLSTTSTSASVS